MAGFEAIYKQTVTLFNRVNQPHHDDESLWYPTVLTGVHLITDESASWNNNGGMKNDNVRLHVRYLVSGTDAMIKCKDPGTEVYFDKKYVLPKDYRRLLRPEEAITFQFGSKDFDFFIEGEFTDFPTPISDSAFTRRGFMDYLNSRYDHVFAITSVSKYNLIPHFEIMAR
ncbi:MAG: hypothetical protein IKO00_04700 [Oscillospiraceae bacterium]|nr:hypothetical protein [Oscillospiraceae bacterium]